MNLEGACVALLLKANRTLNTRSGLKNHERLTGKFQQPWCQPNPVP